MVQGPQDPGKPAEAVVRGEISDAWACGLSGRTALDLERHSIDLREPDKVRPVTSGWRPGTEATHWSPL